MAKTPVMKSLTEDDISGMCDEKVFERGMRYYEEGMVDAISFDESRITAKVRGSYDNRYRVEITEGHDGLDTRCTCPYDMGVCKHVVAVLLSWMNRDKKSVVSKLTDNRQIKESLYRMEKEELVELMMKAVEKDEGIARILKAKLLKKGAIDVEGYKRLARNAVHGNDLDYYSVPAAVDEMRTIVEEINQMADADPTGAVKSLLYVLEMCVEAYDDGADDSDGTLGDFSDDVGKKLGSAVAKCKDNEWVAERLFDLYFKASDYGLDAGVTSAMKGLGKSLLEKMESYCRAKMRSAKGYEKNSAKDLLTDIMEMMGRHEEYMEICSKGGDFEAVVNKLMSLDRKDEAVKLATEKGLWSSLLEIHKNSNEWKPALETAWKLFDGNGWDADIEEIREAAEKLGVWPKEREKAIGKLERTGRDVETLVELYLEKGLVEKAVEKHGKVSSSTAEKIARACERRMPDDAVKIYKKLAKEKISMMGNENYAHARRLLARVKDILKEQGKEDEYATYMSSLRTAHKAKRNLMAELSKLG